MINPFRGYVRTQDKKCVQIFDYKKNAQLLTLEEAEALPEYAGILSGEVTVKDMDDGDEAERVLRLVTDLNLNCRVYKTTRGKQFMFAKGRYADSGIVKQTDALGFTFDVRTGMNQYIVLKYNNVKRDILRDFDPNRPVAEYPKWLAPLSGSSKFTGLADGDGRNEKLFKHVGALVRNRYTVEEIRLVIRLISDYAFADPLPDDEIRKICRMEAIEKFQLSDAAEDFAEGIHPKDYTDKAMAEAFALHHKHDVRYAVGLGWLAWNGVQWEMSELKAQGIYMVFAGKVLEEARQELFDTHRAAALASGTEGEKEAKTVVDAAVEYFKFAIKMCGCGKIKGVFDISKPLLEIPIDELDANPFALNTPAGIIDLRTGETRPHDPSAFCTKMTAVSPSQDGMDMWLDFLSVVTQENADYTNYLQCADGMMAIGKVYTEAAIFAHGSGHNGKSTKYNTQFRVLGDYAGKIPAECLTTRAKNTKVDLAELFGKRFILASETEEGQRLSVSMLKQIASTDDVTAERKYEAPFTFRPTHTTVLYTNHLPRIGSSDRGTWRRIIVAPFNAEITNPQTDFADRLLENAGGAVLAWIIDGARKYIDNGFKLPSCAAVDGAVEQYHEENDWLSTFLAECCIVEKGVECTGGSLYRTYKEWAQTVGEYPRRNRDFAEALKLAGFTVKKTKATNTWLGISLSPTREYGTADDFLGG